MLTESEERGVADEAAREAEEAELEMLVAIATALMALPTASLMLNGLTALMVRLNAIAAKHAEPLMQAVRRAVEGAVALDVSREAKYADAASDAAKKAVSDAAKNARRDADAIADMCRGYLRTMADHGKDAYVTALSQARADAARLGWRPAVENAVVALAKNGISSRTYVRRDGTRVNVPIDVCVRRAVENEGRQRRMTEVLNAAERLGRMVEVSRTRNPRPSHREWEGKVYTMAEFRRACKPGDPVDGIGGYNCGHRVALYKPGRKKRFEDPLKGTGYTREQASKLVSKQRSIENDIRKLKREREVLKSQGIATKDVSRRLIAKQHDLKALIAANPKILKRESHREQIYAKAVKEAKGL